MPERLQKVLAQLGLASRREIEDWIRAGRITVNGEPAELGVRIGPRDKVRVDNRPVRISPARHSRSTRVILYHKPAGEITSRSDPQGRPTVFDNLPGLRTGRWIAVGRLDFNTSGLLLFTTDGELANGLMHPSRELEREYAARVLGEVAPALIQRLQQGVELNDGPARFQRVKDAGGSGQNHWYHVVLKEGRNREVRRLWESQGVQVSRLIRVRYGPVWLPRDLRPGRSVDLAEGLVRKLRQLAGTRSPGHGTGAQHGKRRARP